jgi:hypothetical protein
MLADGGGFPAAGSGCSILVPNGIDVVTSHGR